MNFKEINPIIIGMCGAKQSGKNAVGHLLLLGLPKIPFMQEAFANPIKEDVADAFGISKVDIEQRKNDPIVRRVLQHYGTEWGRQERGENVWVDRMGYKIDGIPKDKRTLVIITDVRFKNEAEFISSRGGCVVTIERPFKDRAAQMDSHDSEQEWYKISPDFRIVNDGSMLDLERNVKWLARDIKERYGI